MNNFKVLALVGVTLAALYGQPAMAQTECRTVRMAEPGWTDLALTTGVFSTLLNSLGYQADSRVLGIPVIYEAMKNKELDVFLGYWDPAMDTYYQAYRDTGEIETVKQNLEGAKFTFAVPRYVYEAGIKDFADLDQHRDKFAGKLYGIEPGSNEIMLDIVGKDAFGLGDWELVESSEQGMLAQVQRATKRQDWIVFLGWAPHPMNNEIDMAYLSGGDDFYGPNFGGATVHTQVRKGYLQDCPKVAKLLMNLDFSIPLESEGMGYILGDGLSAEEAARKLIAAHPELLAQWLDGVESIDGKNGLEVVRAGLGL